MMHSQMSPAIRSIRRRNALVPLPLLPPVPRNTIVTSVRIVHNSCSPDTNDSIDGSPKPNLFFNSANPGPPSPTQSLCFPPLTGAGGQKRPRIGRRRSSCTPCTAPSAQAPCDPNDNSLLNPNRKPRSTIVVTVRLANESPNANRDQPPSNLAPAPRRPDRSANVANVTAAAAAMLARKQANKPRVSSPLASCVVCASSPDRGQLDSGEISPLSNSPTSRSTQLYTRNTVYPSPPRLSSPPVRPYTRRSKQSGSRKAKAKNGGRVGLLRWAVLNNSGPEVGRRIMSMGVKLAQEIWEAERVIEEEDSVEFDETDLMDMEDGNPVRHVEQVEEPPRGDDHNAEESLDVDLSTCDIEEVPQETAPDHGVVAAQQDREKIAEECIRELEEMDVDSEDIEMEAPPTAAVESSLPLASPTVETTESTIETQPTESITNNMEVDAPTTPVVVAPAPARPLQVQVQFEIAVQVVSLAKKAHKELEKPRRWFERIAL